MSVENKYDIVIVGAGVIGLSTAKYLPSGKRVLLIDNENPGSGQSHGAARIFRRVQQNSALIDLAEQAHGAWWAWQEKSKRQLLIPCGGVYLAPDEQEKHDLLSAKHCLQKIDNRKKNYRNLLLNPSQKENGFYDPIALSLVPGNIIKFLLHANHKILKEKVIAIEEDKEIIITSASGRKINTERLLIAAGAGSAHLANDVLDWRLPIINSLHLQLALMSYKKRLPIMQHRYQQAAYGLPTLDGLYMIALNGDNNINLTQVKNSADKNDKIARLQNQLLKHKQQYYSQLQMSHFTEPQTVTHLDGHNSDDFHLWQKGSMSLLAGNNMFKFAPVLGQQLAAHLTDNQKLTYQIDISR